jgi:hypothetical protein
MSDIFISYAGEDETRAEMLARTLEDRGWSTFWDRTIPIGKTWRETIGRELQGARCVIVLWSKNSIDSHWVHEEADDAQGRGILVPILIENVQAPIGFRSIQAAHLQNWDGTEPTRAFHRLIADIAVLIGLPPKETENERRQVEAEIERKAEEERKQQQEVAQRQAEVERQLREAEAKLGEEEERRLRRQEEDAAWRLHEIEAARTAEAYRKQAEVERRAEDEEWKRAAEEVDAKFPRAWRKVWRKGRKAERVPWLIIAGGATIAGVIAIVAVWGPRGSSNLFTRRINTYATGVVIRTADAGSVNECEQLCARNQQCKAYTYSAASRSCALLSRADKFMDSSLWDSGTRNQETGKP